MSTFNNIRQDSRKFSAFTLFALALMLLIALLIILTLTAGPAAASHTGPCTGTYLIDLNNGSKALWTLSADGTFQGTDSAEDYVAPKKQKLEGRFSHSQGNWEVDGSNPLQANLTTLDFQVEDEFVVGQMARVDARLTTGDHCNTVDVDYELRFYDVEAGQDPLDINDGFFGFSDTVSGRRIMVVPLP